MKIYSVKDCVSGVFGHPFLAHSNEEAKRGFDYYCKKSDFAASDFQLFYLGEFDELSGVVVGGCCDFVVGGVYEP